MKEILFYILLIFLFLASAKSHGRQLRLERELEGHWKVTFGAQNHPWVEALWKRDRIEYWVVAGFAAALLFIAWKTWSFSVVKLIALAIPAPMITAFITTGLLSAYRLSTRLAHAPNAEWLRSAIWGSVSWWGLTATLLILLILWTTFGLSFNTASGTS